MAKFEEVRLLFVSVPADLKCSYKLRSHEPKGDIHAIRNAGEFRKSPV